MVIGPPREALSAFIVSSASSVPETSVIIMFYIQNVAGLPFFSG